MRLQESPNMTKKLRYSILDNTGDCEHELICSVKKKSEVLDWLNNKSLDYFNKQHKGTFLEPYDNVRTLEFWVIDNHARYGDQDVFEWNWERKEIVPSGHKRTRNKAVLSSLSTGLQCRITPNPEEWSISNIYDPDFEDGGMYSVTIPEDNELEVIAQQLHEDSKKHDDDFWRFLEPIKDRKVIYRNNDTYEKALVCIHTREGELVGMCRFSRLVDPQVFPHYFCDVPSDYLYQVHLEEIFLKHSFRGQGITGVVAAFIGQIALQDFNAFITAVVESKAIIRPVLHSEVYSPEGAKFARALGDVVYCQLELEVDCFPMGLDDNLEELLVDTGAITLDDLSNNNWSVGVREMYYNIEI